MVRPKLEAAGGWAALRYTLRMARQVGGLKQLYDRMRLQNACKTCAVGMGGQMGGMVNERGRFPEVCKKSLQAQAADMQTAIPESFFAETSLAAMAARSSREMENLGRLGFPIMTRGDHFVRVPWDEALERAGNAIAATSPERFFFYCSGRASNEAAFLAQLVVRAYGSANIHNCSYYCHQASGLGLTKVYGSGTASVTLEDLEHADLAVVIGANPASNHPRLITQLMHLRRRGGKVIVVNPIKELGLVRFRVPSDWQSMLFGSDICDLYLQPRVGGDVALLKALLKGVVEGGGEDTSFIAASTTGYEAVRADVTGADWRQLLDAAGVARAEVDRAVGIVRQAQRGIFMWAMGLTHHDNGVDNVLALANLALARGFLGKPGAGLLPIRGHSNVQGIGSMGVSPTVKEAFARALEQRFDISVARTSGLDTYASMEAAARGDIDSALLLGGNLWGSNPNSPWAKAALQRVGTTIYVSTKLNPGHVLGRGATCIVLPALARDEEARPTSQESMFNFVRLSQGGTPAVAGEMRSEVDIIASIAARILPAARFDWEALRDHASLRKSIAATVAGYGPCGEAEFQVEGRTLHTPPFATHDGRAHFHVTPVPKHGSGFRLITVRSEGQFNTVVYEEEDLYRGPVARDVVMMNEADGAEHGLVEGARVRVATSVGALAATVNFIDIRRGSLAMYYPEANALVPGHLDPRSRTPAFKGVAAWLEPMAPPEHLS
jgi:molybdopterin-dependent oxidoreductase alpha subunit